MAFVKMSNLLGEKITIPSGAVRAYEGLGYTVIEEERKVQKRQHPAESKEVEISEEELFANELEKKPLAQWNKDEVKKYATIRGVDISGTKNAQEAKERIKSFMDTFGE